MPLAEACHAEMPLKELLRGAGERFAAAAEAGCAQGKRGPRDARRRQSLHGVAEPHALEGRVAVAGVDREGNAEASKVGGKPRLGEAEQRPDDGDAVTLRDWAIAASPSSPLPRRKRIRNVSAWSSSVCAVTRQAMRCSQA